MFEVISDGRTRIGAQKELTHHPVPGVKRSVASGIQRGIQPVN
jgi:hypothetical protein